MADTCKQRGVVASLKHEALVYEHLAALQGTVIPVLLGCGFWRDEGIFLVATSIVEGEHPSSDTAAAYPAAEKALRMIHVMGVVHGDIREDNILVSRQGAAFKAPVGLQNGSGP
ncbi:hypothetical protein MNEG_12322 [Monoraphidium neglectum]|uniref:Protein kinase domain-containing protein n=1 Tax=Monoraphidium neglectum TaxID=145388 RepID=A0A0D2LVX2_9CHLO|nr:hypothetical protein MNEG_12322 [Monoraphidium neglectum]KIY95639.1 hypothetical protein MNEG_12322 [Monoraphidium neglectum]|eukprot:XP_013894659.1 hypothetical protein MNEG_12322 [Monoraphidium neglectum]